MAIRDIMTTDLVTVSRDASLQETVTRMLDNRVGSVVVVRGGEPIGIVTETDVLAVGTTFDGAFEDVPVSRAMSENIVTAGPETSVDQAVAILRDHGIKKLPIVEDDELVGIVTLTDLVYHQQDLVAAAKKLEAERTGDVLGENPAE